MPGNPKFASYKNSLQEYCQKRKGAVPQYSSEKQSTGSRWHIGKVTFLGQIFASEAPSDVPKDAEQRAAFAALKGLGYLDKNLQYKNLTHQNAGKLKAKSEKVLNSELFISGTYSVQEKLMLFFSSLESRLYE